MIEKTLNYIYGDNNTEVFSVLSGTSMEKRAEYAPEIQEYIEGLDGKPEKEYALVNALAAGEFFGCFFKGQPILTNMGYSPIEEIKKDDQVWTHTNSFKKVISCFVKDYDGLQTKIKIQNFAEEQTSTENHPFLLLKKENFVPIQKRYYKQKISREEFLNELSQLKPEWINAKEIRPGDYVYSPIDPKFEKLPEQLPLDYAHLFGYYLAEGCLTKRYDRINQKDDWAGIVFVFGKSDQKMIDKLNEIVQKAEHSLFISESQTSDKALRVSVGWKEMAYILEKYLGHHSKRKFIHPEIFAQTDEWIKTFIAAYLDGDGHLTTDADNSRYENTIKFSTVSRNLAFSLQRLLAKIGVVSTTSLGCNKFSNNCFGTEDHNIYEGSIGSYYTPELLEKTLRLKSVNLTERVSKNGGFFILPTGYILAKVKSVMFEEIEKTSIYNLEVEDDNSYVVDFIGHNSNRNGDYFPEKALKDYHKTFEALGHVYTHHVNKDPKLSLGQVKFAHYNDKMKRVELVLELDKSKAKPVIERLDKGELPAVSMGCVQAGTNIILSDFSKKPIENIQVGDEVLTHMGEIHKVTELHPRDYSGKIYTINPVGKYRETITATKEHPWLIIEPDKFFDKDEKNRVIRRKQLSVDDAVWKNSEDLSVHDHLFIPKPKNVDGIDVSVAKAKLLGWYLAEGYTHINDSGVEFSVNEKDQIVQEIDSVLKILQLPEAKFGTRSHSKEALVIRIFSKDLKKEVLKYCGKYSHKKFLHKDIFNWSKEAKLTFLGAYISGDGFFHKNQIYISSCNKQLLEQIQWLGFSIGLNVTIGRNIHGAGKGFSNEETIEWILRFRKTANNELYKYANKIQNIDSMGSGGKGGPFEYEDFYLLGIESIAEENYEGPVYNFEVEKDNSYVVEQYAVHNCRVPKDTCSICGNEATKVANYCEHLKNNMNKVMPNGKKVYAINNQPKFFDISVVTIPAEKTASFIKKLSNKTSSSFDKSANEMIDEPLTWAQSIAKTAELESQAEIKKKIDGKIEVIADDPKNLIRSSQKRLSKETIEKLSEYPLSEILSTFIGLRIVPVREDFQKLALYSMGKALGAEELEKANICFDVNPNLKAIVPEDISLDRFNEKIAGLLIEDLPGMALTKPNIIARGLYKISQADFIEQAQSPEELNQVFPDRNKKERSLIGKVFFGQSEDPVFNSVKSPIVPLGVLGSLYYGYIKTFNNVSTSEFKKFLARHPWIFTAMLGSAAGVSILAQKHVHDLDSFDKKAGMIENAGHVIGGMLITVPGSYYAASFPEQKAQRGIPISSSENFLRKHPALVALGASILGVTGLNTISKQINKFKTLNSNWLKFASVLNRLDEDTLNVIYKDLIIN